MSTRLTVFHVDVNDENNRTQTGVISLFTLGPSIPAGARGKDLHARVETASSSNVRGRNSISSFDEFDRPNETCLQIASRLCEYEVQSLHFPL